RIPSYRQGSSVVDKVCVSNTKDNTVYIPNTIAIDLVGSHSYYGDTGGPLMCDGVQIGVCSTYEYKNKTVSVVYAVVAAYKHWIESTIEEEPYVSMKSNERRYFKCTGTILTDRWILTAAHCADKKDNDFLLDTITYSAGEVTLREDNMDSILSYAIHPDYGARKKRLDNGRIASYNENDLCLLHTKSVIKFDNFVQPACISSSKNITGDCIIVGFGKLMDRSNGDSFGNLDLYFAQLDYEILEGYDHKTKIVWMKDRYPSIGDSGGPLVCEGSQLGVLSQGGESIDGIFVIYTLLGDFKSWIESTTETDTHLFLT
ncbi:hypothetical protein L9F63_014342, partial [Diploptera punctata]